MDETIDLRRNLALNIEVKRLAGNFSFNDFTVVETALPFETLASLNKNFSGGKLFLVALPIPSEDVLSRPPYNLVKKEVAVLVGFQKGDVNSNDLETIDNLSVFVSEVRTACRKFDTESFTFSRSEALKDDNGVPYGYAQLTSARAFDTYFIAYYNLVAA